MKASIPSRHHPPHAAQKPLIWFELSLVRVARRGAAVAVAGVAAMQVLCGEVEKPRNLTGENPKSQTPNPKSQNAITGHGDTETQSRNAVLCVSASLRPL